MTDTRYKHNSKPLLWDKMPLIVGATYANNFNDGPDMEAILVYADTKEDLYRLETEGNWMYEANFDTLLTHWGLKTAANTNS